MEDEYLSPIKICGEHCVVLTLVLKKKWYDMIESGEKRTEYRTSKNVCAQIERWFGEAKIRRINPIVRFCLGYQKNRKTMTFLCRDVVEREHDYEAHLGEPDGLHYAIMLERRAEVQC